MTVMIFWITILFHLVDKCEADGKSVCENGGYCLVNTFGESSCICPKQFEGQHCEIGKLHLKKIDKDHSWTFSSHLPLPYGEPLLKDEYISR